MEQPALTFNKFSLSLEGKKILDNITFQVQWGEYIGLIGPNGAGKTTLLKSILGYFKNQSKKNIVLNPKTILGYVPQKTVLGHQFSLSVKEFLSMGIKGKPPKKQKLALLQEELKNVGLADSFLDKNFHTLSGGEQQRVILARTLIYKPNFLLFDEPLNTLDHTTKIKIYSLLSKLNKKYKITILFVSHEVDYVVQECQRILCLNKKIFTGCHPLEFAKNENYKKKIPVQTPKGTALIHHHH